MDRGGQKRHATITGKMIQAPLGRVMGFDSKAGKNRIRFDLAERAVSACGLQRCHARELVGGDLLLLHFVPGIGRRNNAGAP